MPQLHDPRNVLYGCTTQEAYKFLSSQSRASKRQIVFLTPMPFFSFYGYGGSLFPTSLEGITSAIIWLDRQLDDEMRAGLDECIPLTSSDYPNDRDAFWQEFNSHPF